jgi:hypothetical protein
MPVAVRPPPLVTADDVAAEDAAALAALTPAQTAALERLAQARRLRHFTGRETDESLRLMHETEAARRTAALALAAPGVADARARLAEALGPGGALAA